jgi:hypothetical protein
MEQDDLQSLFRLPLFEEAYEQYCELNIFLHSIHLSGENDGWSYIWGNNQYYSQKAYKHLVGATLVHPAFKWIWSSACQMKQKVFFWLLLMD